MSKEKTCFASWLPESLWRRSQMRPFLLAPCISPGNWPVCPSARPVMWRRGRIAAKSLNENQRLLRKAASSSSCGPRLRACLLLIAVDAVGRMQVYIEAECDISFLAFIVCISLSAHAVKTLVYSIAPDVSAPAACSVLYNSPLSRAIQRD
ncbi:hypothetical protein GQ54DRAFT_96131 [Martensiomyces pterosporus]|nr:hypothetical protein GQ54DRAFT_96131 [Martensiomyces pterosporus]